MRARIFFVVILLMLTVRGAAFSANLETLANDGYRVVEVTKVVGQFKGCDTTTALTLTNGKVFVCSMYAYSFAVFMPVAYVLENRNKEVTVLINGTAYRGSFVEQEKKPALSP